MATKTIDAKHGGLFGNGGDGDLTVSAGTTVVLTDKHYRNLTIESGGILEIGNTSTMKIPTIHVAGTLWVKDGGIIRAANPLSITGFTANTQWHSQTTSKTTAGAGNSVGGNFQTFACSALGGAGGAGGGVTTFNGGNGGLTGSNSSYVHSWPMGLIFGSPSTVGDADAGANGAVPSGRYTSAAHGFSYWTCPRLFGNYGGGGGGGALSATAGTSAGAAGPAGGAGGGCLDIRARDVVVEATGIVHADGAAGTNGSDGVANTTDGVVAGGSGASAGGGGGTVCILYGTLANAGTIRAAGGAAATGGLGKTRTAGVDNVNAPTSNGGNSSAGHSGFVVLTQA